MVQMLTYVAAADSLVDLMMATAFRKAEEIQMLASVSIVDGGGNLKRFARMDGASLSSVAVSQDKAYTAAATGVPTHELYEFIKDNPILLRGVPEYPRIIVIGGGYPLILQGAASGGIGVSGGSPDQDMAVARAALAVLET